MKIQFLVLSFFFHFSFLCGQELDNSYSPKVGFYGGMNLSTLSVEENNDGLFTAIVGYRYGATVEFPLKYNFAIINDLGYDQKGVNRTFNNKRVRLDYLTLSSNLAYQLKKMIFLGGFYYGQIIGKDVLYGKSISSIPRDRNEFKNNDFGLNFGVGAKLKEKAVIQFIYHKGLRNIDPDPYTVDWDVIRSHGEWTVNEALSVTFKLYFGSL